MKEDVGEQESARRVTPSFLAWSFSRVVRLGGESGSCRGCCCGSGLEIEIEIEIVYNMYRMRRFFTKSRMRRLLSLGPPNYAIQGTYKSGLDR